MATRGFEHVTASQLERARPAAAAPSKYRNVKWETDGITFHSKREAAYYLALKARLAAGEIRDLRRQVAFPLFAPVLLPPVSGGGYVQIAEYVADFVYEERYLDRWELIIADCKGGPNTRLFALKRKWLELQSGLLIREVR
jgi:hypothetical protein